MQKMFNQEAYKKACQQTQRPDPPPGFIPFRWKHQVMDRGKTSHYTAPKCPNCGSPKFDGDKWGYIWGGKWGFTDPGAQAAFDEAAAQGIRLIGAGDATVTYEGVPILLHWSRYSMGKCVICGCELWHDWKGGDLAYYRPTDGQLALPL